MPLLSELGCFYQVWGDNISVRISVIRLYQPPSWYQPLIILALHPNPPALRTSPKDRSLPPSTPHPTYFTLHHKCCTVHPTPYTLHPTPYTLQLYTSTPQPLTLPSNIDDGLCLSHLARQDSRMRERGCACSVGIDKFRVGTRVPRL